MPKPPKERPQDRVERIVAEYREKLSVYGDLARACKELVERLLSREGVRVHSVECRAKTPDSLKAKLARKERQCEALDEVTDLAGVRIITYYSDEVDVIGMVVEREFAVVPGQSIDKRKALDPDRFGYLSLHYVCRLPPRRTRLPEYAPYRGYMCEIQVRSILQHGWAEIEHDQGYKAAHGVPRPIRRRFSRLAGLLELADDEFMRIRDELAAYAAEVKKDITEKPSEVLVDKVSLQAFIEQDSTVRRVDQKLADWAGVQLEAGEDWVEDLVEDLAGQLRDVGLNTIQEVRTALVERESIIVRQWQIRSGRGEGGFLGRGIALFHLWQVLLAEEGDPLKIVAACRKYGIWAPAPHEVVASEFIEAVRKASAEEGAARRKRSKKG